MIVQQAGNPIDLALLHNLNQLFDTARESNERLEELQAVKQALSIALHEQYSADATFIYNRCFFTAARDYARGTWDLGDGKALWRGFYSCLVFAKDKYQLMMNLDGEQANRQCAVSHLLFISVKYSVFMKKQPFLDFVGEVMLNSPSGKHLYGRDRQATSAKLYDIQQFLHRENPRSSSEASFLLKQCKSESEDEGEPAGGGHS